MADLVIPPYVEPEPDADPAAHTTPESAPEEVEELSEEAKLWNEVAELHCLPEGEEAPQPEYLKERPKVRAVEFQTPPELTKYLVCYICGFTPLPRRAFALHVDTLVNEKKETKSQTVYACTPACRDAAEMSLSVLKALGGDLNAETET